MRDGRRIIVRHDQSIPQRMNNMCMNCRCDDGRLRCMEPEDDTANCMRSDPDEDMQPRSCMMEDGEMLMHNEQREVSTHSRLYIYFLTCKNECSPD